MNQRIHGIKNKNQLDDIVERSLKNAALWDEVSDRLKKVGSGPFGRAAAASLASPGRWQWSRKSFCMDEPTSALDPISTLKIEDLMDELKQKYTVVIVTHNMQQATRIADYTAFFLVGEIIEYAPTTDLFSHPKERRQRIISRAVSADEDILKQVFTVIIRRKMRWRRE